MGNLLSGIRSADDTNPQVVSLGWNLYEQKRFFSHTFGQKNMTIPTNVIGFSQRETAETLLNAAFHGSILNKYLNIATT